MWKKVVQMMLLLPVMGLVAMPVASAAGQDMKALRAKLEKSLPGGLKVTTIKKSPVKGIYEVHSGSRIMYVTADARHLFVGSLIDLKRELNLTREAQKGVTVKRLARVDESTMLIIGPKKAKHTLTVFTDVDCGYCSKLHLEVPKLNKNGIRVRYLFYPRAGVGSQSYKRAVAVWCAKDRVKAIGAAKARKPIDMKECKNPIADHYVLGQELGLNGTPMLIMDDGTIINGYQPAPELIKAFKAKTKG
ncbi:MAG: DsbC family protein [Proteobacteria bacterium]|nr:DsbC family protein [Pseudomonadota bacterium]